MSTIFCDSWTVILSCIFKCIRFTAWTQVSTEVAFSTRRRPPTKTKLAYRCLVGSSPPCEFSSQKMWSSRTTAVRSEQCDSPRPSSPLSHHRLYGQYLREPPRWTRVTAVRRFVILIPLSFSPLTRLSRSHRRESLHGFPHHTPLLRIHKSYLCCGCTRDIQQRRFVTYGEGALYFYSPDVIWRQNNGRT